MSYGATLVSAAQTPSVARRMMLHFRPPAGATGPQRTPAIQSSALPDPSCAISVTGETIHLSERENEVLRLIEKGLTYDEIAQVLGITWHTVTGYLRRVYKKLEVNSRGEAVFEARARGLI